MAVHGVRTYAENFGYILALHSIGNQREHRPLPFGEQSVAALAVDVDCLAGHRVYYQGGVYARVDSVEAKRKPYGIAGGEIKNPVKILAYCPDFVHIRSGLAR